MLVPLHADTQRRPASRRQTRWPTPSRRAPASLRPTRSTTQREAQGFTMHGILVRFRIKVNDTRLGDFNNSPGWQSLAKFALCRSIFLQNGVRFPHRAGNRPATQASTSPLGKLHCHIAGKKDRHGANLDSIPAPAGALIYMETLMRDPPPSSGANNTRNAQRPASKRANWPGIHHPPRPILKPKEPPTLGVCVGGS